MSIYHCSIKIISRAGGRSAVASAAYRSGEKLYNEETGLTHDFRKKHGIVMNEILLPVNAPDEYHDRGFLWNQVQKVEKRSDAQFAREVEVALPIEMSRQEQIECVRFFIMDNFVSEGMIADWALHDKEDGNPHAHIMLTLRGFDEKKKWMDKQKSVFANARDENGRAIFDPTLPSYDPKRKEETAQYKIPVLDANGNQKTRVRKGKGTEYLWEKVTVPVNNWNDRSQAEKWRESWAKHCNWYLEENRQIDHRSYERQGLECVPTVHEGVVARQMEAEGKTAERCEINREIREHNLILKQIMETAAEITKIVTEKARDILDRFKEFGRSAGNVGETGRDVGSFGSSGEGNRRIAGTAYEISEFEQTAGVTNQKITDTDRYIEKLRSVIQRKKEQRNERYRNFMERRRASERVRTNAGSGGGTAGREPEPSRTFLTGTADDLRGFLNDLRIKERAAEQKREDHRTEWATRETIWSGEDIRKKQGTTGTEPGIEQREQQIKRRGRTR